MSKKSRLSYIRWVVTMGFLGAIALLYGSPTACAAVYRWKNEKGQFQYSSAPPQSPIKNVEVKQGSQWYPYSAKMTPLPEPTPTFSTVVPYQKRNAVMVIPVTINGSIERPLAVDTGASYTIISAELASTLNLKPHPTLPPITLETANGRIDARLVNLQTVTVGGLSSHNVIAAIHDLDDTAGIAGLLGLNFLNRFKMTVDAPRNQLLFEAIEPPAASLQRDCLAGREWLLRGQALQDGSEEEASYYRQAIALCPDLLDAYYALGLVYYQQKAYQEAINVHHQILRLHPDDPDAHYRLGVLYLLERQFVLAKGEFQTTIQLNPQHPHAQEYLEQLKNY